MEFSFNDLDIDEYLEKLNDLVKAIESTLKSCSRKYKDKQEIEELYSNLNKFLNNENLNESKYLDELTFIEKDFKKSHNLNEVSRKKLFDYKEKLKNLNIELKSMKTMLDKSNSSWTKFNESYSILESWLDQQENLNDVSNSDFSNYQKYQKLHSQFNESANFLIQVSDPFSCSQIKEHLLYINKLWKSYQDKFKDTVYEQYLKILRM
ncbi:unnamed protein product [Brachionus calyciflorus]|uniref:Nesprin-1 spectrin repeats region domain-containing protein n=1 Tax=Brachionus calyciflorus TaxID=104777 RepID=A0A813MA61_9BILA|nr:unnamed protein product [Brachionus calyciflorus]